MSAATPANDHARRRAQEATLERNLRQSTPSSRCCIKNSAGKQPVKILTNFSIDSIIGRIGVIRGPSSRYELKDSAEKEQTKIESAQRSSVSEPNGNVQARNATCSGRHGQAQPANANRSKRPALESRKYRPKNYQCPVCGMAFSNNGQLKNHVRIHTGERPFRCNQSNCGKTFTRNEELTRHKLIHTGVRPHSCPSCPKSFGRKDHLKKHVKTHERKKPRKGFFVTSTRLARRTNTVDEATGDKLMLLSPRKDKDGFGAATATNEINSLKSMSSFMTSFSPPSNAQYNPYTDSGAFLSLSLSQPPLLPPVTFAPTRQSIDPTFRGIESTIARPTPLDMLPTTIATSGSLQQMAGDYWQKWYDLLGFYQS